MITKIGTTYICCFFVLCLYDLNSYLNAEIQPY